MFGVITGIQDANAQEIPITSVPLRTSYSYTGREYDSESGYYYYRARYYDAQTGRFLQKDPEPGKIGFPSTVINSYVYTANNSVNSIDPSGKLFWLLAAFLVDLAVTATISGIVVGTVTGLIKGTVALASGGNIGDFFNAFGSGFVEGFVNGAIQGALSFGLGAGLVALKYSAEAAATIVGGAFAAGGFYSGYQSGGLAGGLLGATGGFISGTLGGMGGAVGLRSAASGVFPSVGSVAKALLHEILSPQIPNYTEFAAGAGAGVGGCAGVKCNYYDSRN